MPLKTPSNMASAKRKRARPSKPRLHIDLENMVLNTFKELCSPQDLTWLWVGGRHVSRNFRYEIERLFKIFFLPKTILRCDMGLNLRCWDIFTPDDQSFPGCYTESSTTNGCMDSCFTLDRFSDDHTRAFFKPGENSSEEGFLFRRLHEKQLVGDPIFSIQVREVVNDTGLPELQIDDDEDEISFDWRGMLDQLMGEEHVFNTILSQRLGWYLEPGDDAVNILETHRKLARRSRYQRECRAKYETNILNHYVNGEAQALKSLSHLRLAASGSNSVHDDDKKNNKKKKKDPNVYTKQEILDELPDDAVIYSGNSDPSPEPGSIPRGIFTSQDYCWYNSSELPPPSTMDLFSQRPLPDLSWGRRRLDSVPRMKRKLGLSQGKRAREEEQGVLPAKRGKNATG